MHFKRIFIAVSSFLLLSLLSASAVIFWCAYSQSGLQFLANQVHRVSKGVVFIDQPQGYLLGRMNFKTMRYREKNNGVLLSGVEVQWQPAMLWSRSLLIDKIAVHDITLTNSKSTEPLKLPNQLALPFSVDVKKMGVGSLRFGDAVVNDIAAAMAYKNKHFDVLGLSAVVEGVNIQMSGRMADAAPYVLSATIHSSGKTKIAEWSAQTTLAGTIHALDVQASGAATSLQTQEPQVVNVAARLLPTQRQPIERVTIMASAFNPNAWFAKWPTAKLMVQMHIKPIDKNIDPAIAKATPMPLSARVFAGDIEVTNLLPGEINAGLLPLQSLAATFNGSRNTGQASIERLLLMTHAMKFAGQLSGQMRWGDSVQSGEFTLNNVNPAAIHGSAQPVLLTGQVSLNANGVDGPLHLAGQVRSGVRALVFEIAKHGSQVNIQNAELSDSKARVSIQGRLGLQEKMPLQLTLITKHFDPSVFVKAPSGQWNMVAQVDAHLKPSLIGAVQLRLNDSVWAAEKFSGDAAFQIKSLKPMQLEGVRVNLNLAGNTLNASGAYGHAGGHLAVHVDAQNLAALGGIVQQPLSGALTADIRTQGVFPIISGDVKIKVTQLNVPNQINIASANGAFAFGKNDQDPWAGQLTLQQLSLLNQKKAMVPSAVLTLSGTRQAHELGLKVVTLYKPFGQRDPEIALQATLKGGLNSNHLPGKERELSWRGQLINFQLDGVWRPLQTLSLFRPVDVRLSNRQVQIGATELMSKSDAKFYIDHITLDHSLLSTVGRIDQLQLPRISPIIGEQFSVEPKNLQTNVVWNWKSDPNTMAGEIRATYHSGDLELLGDRQTLSGLKQFLLSVKANNQYTQMTLNAESEKIGVVTGALRLPMQQAGASLPRTIAKLLPMHGELNANLNNIVWIGPLLDPNLRAEGGAQVSMSIAGTPAQPKATGYIASAGLELGLVDEGLRLSEGDIRIDFDENQVNITRATFIAGNRQAPRDRIRELGPLIVNSGKIQASGHWALSGRGGDVRVDIKGLAALQRADRWLMFSGQLALAQPAAAKESIKLTGKLRADGAYIEFPKTPIESLDDDVVIKGRATGGGAAKSPIVIDIQTDLGDKFYFSGNGLQSRLAGGIRLRSEEPGSYGEQKDAPKRLKATGTMRAEEGTFDAYGQQLTIQRGILNFQGQMDNPGLNVRAVRAGLEVEAGVEVTGTAKRPRIRLVSDPAVPDAEKLSWMVLGRGSDRLNTKDSGVLLTAATALLSGQNGNEGGGFTKQLAQSLGVDDIGLTTGSLTGADRRTVGSRVAVAPGSSGNTILSGNSDPLLNQRIVSVGKRLSNTVYLAYDQSLTTVASVVKLTYQITRQLSVIGRAGADNAIDVLYQLSFD